MWYLVTDIWSPMKGRKREASKGMTVGGQENVKCKDPLVSSGSAALRIMSQKSYRRCLES